MTKKELKAYAFDLVVNIQNYQAELNRVTQQLQTMPDEETVETKKEEEK